MDTMNRATHRLTERVAAECLLMPADVEFLLAHHHGHVRLAPTGLLNRYRVTPLSHVGTIVGPNCRLLIRPKIPLQSLFHLLDPTAPLPVTPDHTAEQTGTEALEFLAGRLARLLAERAAAGLHRAYVEKTETGPFLQGRLDVAAQLREPAGRKDKIHCCYEEFTADIPCNQIPRATAELVLRSALPGNAAHSSVRQSLTMFAEVRPVALAPTEIQAVAADRRIAGYRPLLDVCRLLTEALDPGETAGTTDYPAFLLDMDRVFEHYVTGGVVRACAGSRHYSVAVQPPYLANRPVAGQPNIHLRPDVTIDCDGRPVVVVDAKWKRRAGCPVVTEDLYQVLAYATALGARQSVLVYPGKRDRRWQYALANSPVRLDLHVLQVVGSRRQCDRSLVRLGKRLVREIPPEA
jgi:5-methylcytosine-specific restriction endonuclease McrBC regulatory subunit McrC